MLQGFTAWHLLILVLLILVIGLVVLLVVLPSKHRKKVASGEIVLQDKTNTLSIVALIGAFVMPIIGVICGHISLSQIKRTNERGWGMSVAALIISYFAIIAGIVTSIVLVAMALHR